MENINDKSLTNLQHVQQFFVNRCKNLTKNITGWLPHALTAGAVATIASTFWRVWPLNAARFIAGSAFLTGGLSFIAFEIGRNMGDSYADGIIYGLAATVAFSYIASVPLITVLSLTVLGELGKIILEQFI